MGEIKSAAEIAREKLEKIGDPTPEERLQWKYTPEGEKLAAKYLTHKCDLAAELAKFDAKARPYVAAGISTILARNITLPRNEAAYKANTKAMDGLRAVKKDQTALEEVFARINHVLTHYNEQGLEQKQQAYDALKAEMEEKVQQALQQQTGINAKMNIDITKQPQFQEEWRKIQAQFDEQYMNHLNQYKQELAAVK